jgi:hypothetical protein
MTPRPAAALLAELRKKALGLGVRGTVVLGLGCFTGDVLRGYGFGRVVVGDGEGRLEGWLAGGIGGGGGSGREGGVLASDGRPIRR